MPPEMLQLLLLGMVSGASICSLSCLPYLAPYLMGTGSGFRDGMGSTAVFLAGKICCYTLIGGLAGLGGGALLPQGSPASARLAGAVLILAALTIPFAQKRGCPKGQCRPSGKRLALFGLGISSSLHPCPALAAVMVMAAEKATILAGLGYGAAFGLGLALSPMVMVGGGLSLIADRLRLESGRLLPAIRAISVVIMVGMGLQLMLAAPGP